MTIPTFSDFPDSAAFRDIQRALWSVGEARGAALMVGAGLSRLAMPAAADAKLLPLWSDFSHRMTSELYSANPDKAPYDPLRLAEEYKSALGQPSLDALIRDMVPDLKWNPGDAHQRLVRLPWSDILTTNWDTLIERAANSDPERKYELVLTPQDIIRARSPRIVKLHGSLPTTQPFIFTQEDYRTYPVKFAPFVNLAQQALLENELCLLGFSGNDPNFLQWSGWVRDQLGSSARPIRLIGVLNLPPSQRALLMKQNITPIDLAPLVAGVAEEDAHAEAIRLFIDELFAGKPAAPNVWTRAVTRSSEPEKAEIDALLTDLEKDRENYPGWLIPPNLERHILRLDTGDAIAAIEAKLPSMSAQQKSKAAFELYWRIDKSFWQLPTWLADLGLTIVCDKYSDIPRSRRHIISIILARSARTSSDATNFETNIGIADTHALTRDEQAAVAYERCLYFRDQFDFHALDRNVASIAGDDPAWMMRKAALLATLKREKEAALLLRECGVEIRRRRTQDRHSLWLLSREAWVKFLLRHARMELRSASENEKQDLDNFEEWPHRYSEQKCDPWDELRAFDESLDSEFEYRAKIARRETPHFDAGSRRLHGRGDFWRSNIHISPWYELNRIVDQVGLTRFHSIDVIESRLERTGKLLERETLHDWLAIIRATRKREDGLIDSALSRIMIAKASPGIVKAVFDKVRDTIDFGRARLWLDDRYDDGSRRISGWVEEVRLLMEIASRLVVGLPETEAVEAFRWACEIGHSPEIGHWWLYEPLSNLLERCLDAISPNTRCSLALDMLKFPIVGHAPKNGMTRYWPNFSNRLASLKHIDRIGTGWSTAISAGIETTKSDHPEHRTRGILQLLPLYRQEVLNDDEKAAFTHALWEQCDGPDYLPSNTDIYPSAFLAGPEPQPGRCERAFRSEIIALLVGGTFTETALIALSRAGYGSDEGQVLPTATEAAAILDHMLTWQVSVSDDDEANDEEQGITIAMGSALARSILPVLRNQTMTDNTARQLLDRSDASEIPEFMEGLPEISHLYGLEANVVERIRLGLASSKSRVVNAAIRSLMAWSNLASETQKKPPEILATELANACLARRPKALYGALHTAVLFAEHQHFANDDKFKLVAALDILAIETAYQNVDINDPIVVTLTLVRKECVRLAAALASDGMANDVLKQWLAVAEIDPMPEVRFALSDN